MLSKASLEELYAYHYRARGLTLDAAEHLTAKELVRDMQVGWRNIRNTILHGLETEVFWIQHILQGGPRPDWDFGGYTTVGAMRNLAAEVRRKSLAYLEGLEEAQIGELRQPPFPGNSGPFSVGKVLLHVVIHESHHRGQVMAMLRQLGYAPPEVDLL